MFTKRCLGLGLVLMLSLMLVMASAETERFSPDSNTLWDKGSQVFNFTAPVVGEYSFALTLKNGDSPGTLSVCVDGTTHTIIQHTSTATASNEDWSWRVERATSVLTAGTHQIWVLASGGHVYPSTLDIVLLPVGADATKGVKVMNNLVMELLNVQMSKGTPDQQYKFRNPKDGWVFISSGTATEESDRVFIVIDSAKKEDAVIIHDKTAQTQEAMRYLLAGEHSLNVYCEGKAFLKNLVVRSIPEILYAEIGYGPPLSWMRSYIPYKRWDYLEKSGILKDVNVIIERAREQDEEPEHAPFIQAWKRQGRKMLAYNNIGWLFRPEVSGHEGPVTADSVYNFWSSYRGRGFTNPELDGIILDELAWDSYPQEIPYFVSAIRRISQNQEFKGKHFRLYCSNMYKTELGKSVINELLDAGYKFVYESYLVERPTELLARELLEAELRLPAVQYREAFPDCQKNMIMCLSYMTAPPETVDIHPGVDWKVYMDMQFNYIANDPAFSGLYGVMSYHSSYADEEDQRWVARLYRHYCIEGRRERLSKDPYMLSHIQNGDFDDGTTGWTLEPAEEGSISVKNWPGRYFWLQGRFAQTGDNFIWTKRSSKAPNRFSQEIKKVQPGRLYSLKMMTADYGELVSGESVKQNHQMSIKIEGAELIPEKCFQEIFGSGEAGHSDGPFNRQNQLFITFHRMVFRAKKEDAKMTISDWPGDKEPGGPLGQELIHNFIQLQPYLED